MDTPGILTATTTASTLLGIALVVYKNINHRRCRSNCCGQKLEMSVDVENTTPPPERFEVNNPIAVRQEQIQRSTQILIPNP